MKVLTDNKYYGQIANVIREQNGTNNTYTPPQMVSALKDLFYEEVEGVPPITYNGIGENLLDYRIYGASGGVGDRTSNLFNCELENKAMNWETGKTIANSTNRITTTFFHLTLGTYFLNADILEEATIFHYSVDEIYKSASQWYTLPAVFTIDEDEKIKICFRKKDLSETPISENYNIIVREGSTATQYEPYGYKVPVVISGKNLFNKNDVIEGSLNPFDGKTIVYNNQLHTKNYIPVTTNDVYIISGLDYGIRLHEYNSNHNFIKSYVVNNNNSFTVSNNCAYIRVAGSINQFLDTGMINLGSTSLPYEPYHEPTTTNIYLDEPIEEGESISLSDTNTNIPTIRGINVLTVDTTVQPSNVYVKSRHESSYETAMRERYEEAQAQLDALESGGE